MRGRRPGALWGRSHYHHPACGAEDGRPSAGMRQRVPAVAAVAHARGALVIDDNTWATPLFHRSLDQGVDISMQAATKYIGGHSDIMFGTISANASTWPTIIDSIRQLGVCAGPDDVFLAIRGLRTLSV